LPVLKKREVSAVRLIWPNNTNFLSDEALIKICPPTTSFSFSTIANTVPFNPQADREVLDFTEIAKLSEGAEYLAALKMDVDNFTRVSTDGLVRGGATSLAHRMALSHSFSYFFLGYINAIAHDYPLSAPDSTPQEPSSKIYTVFAGGDDLFLLGPWEVVIDAAYRIRQDFRRYTANPNSLTISAGITYFKPTFPIRRFSQLTFDTLDEKAKKLKDKDALSLFGEVLHWDHDIGGKGRIEQLSFETLYDFAKDLAQLVEKKRAGEEVSHSFLMSLLTLKRTSLDQGRIDWQWNLPYLIARAVEGTSAESKKRELLYRFMEKGNLWFRSSEVPLMWVFLKTRKD